MSVLQVYPQDEQFLYVCGNPESSSDDSPLFEQVGVFAQRRQTMPPMYLYELSYERLWNACKMGWTAADVITFLRRYAVSPLPTKMQNHICTSMGRFGDLRLYEVEGGIELRGSAKLMAQVRKHKDIARHLRGRKSLSATVDAEARVALKMALAAHGFPVLDDGVRVEAPRPLQIALHPSLHLRSYQRAAIEQFVGRDDGSGVIVLPCGAGKTVVGLGTLAALQCTGLILVPNEAAAKQWEDHFLKFTNLTPSEVGIDDGTDALKPVTITTYQRLTARRKSGEYYHFGRYVAINWGLVVYDEVHLLPAPLFRLSAELQCARRLGLSATLVREDGRTADVFSLVGPKVYEVHEDRLTAEGYLSQVTCVEVQVAMSDEAMASYEQAPLRQKHRAAADNQAKLEVVEALCRKHRDGQILIMGHYTQFLKKVSERLSCPMLDGETPKEKRLHEYDRFRQGHTRVLVLSRIANVAVDLPNADVAIQVSGLFGSRQEEAQRLGRVLRPKPGGGRFYTLVSVHTLEERTARHRQQFLVERGFAYTQVSAADIISEGTIANEVRRVPKSRVRGYAPKHSVAPKA
ncbi:DEAD/DEAH box helicase family protein [Alicyclobacillus fastidiosus]|uniref:DNA 3'-5' helicase n=1 Tax=Alicyclobacillus fastidiosus TaxID=392011 RepID=A0ABV5AAV0_9BACL